MATWKKLHHKDANTEHGTITAALTDVTGNVNSGGTRHLVIVSNDGGSQQELKTQSFAFGANAFTNTAIPAAANDGVLTITGGAGLSGSGTFTANDADNVGVTLAVNVDDATIEITTDTLNVKANGIGASQLNVTGNGTTGQMLTSDGDGSFSWTTPGGVADAHSGITGATDVNNSGLAYVQDITMDEYGHVTAIASTSIPNASTGSSGVVTTGTQSFAGAKTFTGAVTVQGNLIVEGTTTTIESTTLTVQDKDAVLAYPDTAYSTDVVGNAAAVAAATDGGILLTSHSGTDTSYFAGVTWDPSAQLTGWQVRDTAGSTDHAIAVMHVATGAPVDATDNLAGIGSLWVDTTGDSLYIRVD